MSDPYLIELTSDGEGRTDVDLGDTLVTMVTRFNYYSKVWTMDILDALGETILSGLMLVPGVDLLSPYAQQKELLGGLVLLEESVGDYLSDARLGTNTKLFWFPPGTEIFLSA